MKFLILLFGLSLVFVSCKKPKEKAPFEMYQTSELSLIMEEMYVFNDSIKQQILSNRVLSEMPYDLKQLHTAKMTGRFERDDNFNNLAQVYTEFQKKLYSTSQDSIKMIFNNGINTCVACHQNSCTGPIPRIKKLLINE